MSILVTGGTGFLGRHLIQQLVESGEKKINVLTRSFDEGLAELGVTQIEGSLLDGDALKRALKNVKQVYHLAGRVERDPSSAHLMYELHVDGTRHLLDRILDTKVEKIVVASTSGTVGVSKFDDYIADDDSPTVEEVVSKWPYYLSKIYAERVCERYIREYDLPIVMMRPTLLLGPGDERKSSTEDVEKFLNGDIPSVPSGGLSFVDVRDVANAFILAMESGGAGDTFLLGAQNLTVESFFDELATLSGKAAPKLHLPQNAAVFSAKVLDSAMKFFGKRASVDPVSVDMSGYYWYINSENAETKLGWIPREPRLTLRDTIKDIRHRQERNETPPEFGLL